MNLPLHLNIPLRLNKSLTWRAAVPMLSDNLPPNYQQNSNIASEVSRPSLVHNDEHTYLELIILWIFTREPSKNQPLRLQKMFNLILGKMNTWAHTQIHMRRRHN